MKKLMFLPLLVLALSTLAQDGTEKKKKKEKIDLSNRANDHLMLQIGMAGWPNLPDSINQQGFSRSFNAYFLFDFPFKSNPKMSMAAGAGISSDHIIFSKSHVGIKDNSPVITFINLDDTNHYKKTKLATVYAEAPVELRYSNEPATGKGIKAAIGVKAGFMLGAHTRNTKYEDKSGNSLGGHVVKEASTKFFNKNRISLTARLGYGHFSIFGSYQLTALFKDGNGPIVKPYSIGITLSGL